MKLIAEHTIPIWDIVVGKEAIYLFTQHGQIEVWARGRTQHVMTLDNPLPFHARAVYDAQTLYTAGPAGFHALDIHSGEMRQIWGQPVDAILRDGWRWLLASRGRVYEWLWSEIKPISNWAANELWGLKNGSVLCSAYSHSSYRLDRDGNTTPIYHLFPAHHIAYAWGGDGNIWAWDAEAGEITRLFSACETQTHTVNAPKRTPIAGATSQAGVCVMEFDEGLWAWRGGETYHEPGEPVNWAVDGSWIYVAYEQSLQVFNIPTPSGGQYEK